MGSRRALGRGGRRPNVVTAGQAVTVLHGVVVRRGYFAPGTGLVLPEGSAGLVHARARFGPGAPTE